MAGLAIQNLTRRRTAPRAAFLQIAKDIAPDWDLSLVFVGAARAKKLNQQLRRQDYVPNVLSFALGKKSGEIFICLSEVAKQADEYEMSTRDFALYLFIHGILHIKGWAHGAKMEKCEKSLLLRYGTAYSNRHRHRHVPGKNGRGRRSL